MGGGDDAIGVCMEIVVYFNNPVFSAWVVSASKRYILNYSSGGKKLALKDYIL
jgi:hypothetical protein